MDRKNGVLPSFLRTQLLRPILAIPFLAFEHEDQSSLTLSPPLGPTPTSHRSLITSPNLPPSQSQSLCFGASGIHPHPHPQSPTPHHTLEASTQILVFCVARSRLHSPARSSFKSRAEGKGFPRSSVRLIAISPGPSPHGYTTTRLEPIVLPSSRSQPLNPTDPDPLLDCQLRADRWHRTKHHI